jgi:hypothetical protein
MGFIEPLQFNSESETILKLEMLSSLYFPELLAESLELKRNFRLLQNEISNSNHMAKELLIRQSANQLTQADLELLNHLSSDPISPINANIPNLHQQFIKSISSLSGKAKKLLAEIMEI